MNSIVRIDSDGIPDFLDGFSLPDTKDIEFLWSWLSNILRTYFDIEGIFYMAYPVGDSGGTPETLILRAVWKTSYPQDYLEAMPGNPLTNDYSANHVLETGEVSRWHDPESLPKMTPGERKRIELDEEYNMAVGACFPIYTSNNRICGGYGLRSKSQNREVFDAMLQMHTDRIGRLLGSFDQRFRGPLARDTYKLSPQEVRVLAFLAGGMAVSRIAHEMTLSPKTVEAYMSSARKKTSSSTSAEAVAKAIFFNLV
jgi:DNA-binding CsgD family transcriptional regulator